MEKQITNVYGPGIASLRRKNEYEVELPEGFDRFAEELYNLHYYGTRTREVKDTRIEPKRSTQSLPSSLAALSVSLGAMAVNATAFI